MKLEYTGSLHGRTGDVVMISLDTNRLRSVGWEPRAGVEEGVKLSAQ